MNGLQFLALVIACAVLFLYATKKENSMTTRKELQDLMDFGHVIEVHKDGTITEPAGEYAPELDAKAEELDNPNWSLLRGYTGQHGYSGPVMHDSEFIGGRLADDILSSPGFYVCIAADYYTDPEGNELDEPETEGWVIAFKPSSETN